MSKFFNYFLKFNTLRWWISEVLALSNEDVSVESSSSVHSSTIIKHTINHSRMVYTSMQWFDKKLYTWAQMLVYHKTSIAMYMYNYHWKCNAIWGYMYLGTRSYTCPVSIHTLSLSSDSWVDRCLTNELVSSSCTWRSFISFCSCSGSSISSDMHLNRGNHSRLTDLDCVWVRWGNNEYQHIHVLYHNNYNNIFKAASKMSGIIYWPAFFDVTLLFITSYALTCWFSMWSLIWLNT